MDEQRIEWVDTLKGLAMIFIYLGHLTTSVGKTYLYVFSFHVPLFFFISGFFNKDVERLTMKQYFLKQCKILLLPYFVFCILNSIWVIINSEQGLRLILHLGYQSLLASRYTHFNITLWFLPALFVVKILFYSSKKIIKSKVILLIFALSIAVLRSYLPVIQFFSIHAALGYFQYFVLGYLLFETLKVVYPLKSIQTLLFFISLCVSCLVFFKGMNVFTSGFTNPFVISFIQVSLTVIQIFFWVNIAKFLPNFTVLKSIGQNTLYLCGTEVLNKEIINQAATIFGMTIKISSPIAGYIFCGIALIIGLEITVPFFKKITKKVTEIFPLLN